MSDKSKKITFKPGDLILLTNKRNLEIGHALFGVVTEIHTKTITTFLFITWCYPHMRKNGFFYKKEMCNVNAIQKNIFNNVFYTSNY